MPYTAMQGNLKSNLNISSENRKKKSKLFKHRKKYAGSVQRTPYYGTLYGEVHFMVKIYFNLGSLDDNN